MSALFAGLSALAYGSADYAGGFASRSHPVHGVLAVTQSVSLVGVVTLAILLRQPFPAFRDLMLGAVGGLSGIIGLTLLYRGLSTGSTAVVSPAAAFVGTSLPVVAGTLFGESPPPTSWIGISFAVPAVLLLSLSPSGDRRFDLRSLALGAAAGLSFGGYFIVIDQTAQDSGFWPLAAARVGSLLLISLTLVVRTRRKRENEASPLPSGTALVAALIAGGLDMAANVFFLVATRIGMLATSAVIASLYPAPTVLLSRIRDRERLGPLRVVGVALALAGVGLISL